MKKIAWGCSKLLHLYCTATNDHDWAYVVDNYATQKTFLGLEVKRWEALREEEPTQVRIYVFAVSNDALVSILAMLGSRGWKYGDNVFIYSDLFESDFRTSVKAQLNWDLDTDLLKYSTAYTLNSRKPIHTTICGTWLFLEALRRLRDIPGNVAEVGAYEGGNALCALQSPVWPRGRDYYVFDSFEGFPDLSSEDPASFSRGDYKTQKSLCEILSPFQVYDEAKIIKGFVPGTFALVPSADQFSFIFYDCDLYQPALDTYEFFWDRLPSRGMLMIHDYYAEPGGFAGVHSATEKFFADRPCQFASFWHNTMAIAIKP